MTRPLYRASMQPRTLDSGGNAGLWFDKFCNTWTWRRENQSWTMSANDQGNNPKLNWLRTVADRGSVGISKQIEETASRLARLVQGKGGRLAVFETESRFVTGLGRSHPVENGFAWHPTLGTPYLPGSSIKGLVRSWAREQAEPSPDPAAVGRLLGAPRSAGGICFLDAVPLGPVRLEADVMTPHYAGWSKDDPPGDWCSPNPIPFLVTAAGTRFLFGAVPCLDLEKQDLDLVMHWLGDALSRAGAGAKTAVGYGRYRRDDPALEELELKVASKTEELRAQRRESERRARLTPLERELEELSRARPGAEPGYLAWIEALEAGRWEQDPDTRLSVARRVKEEMERTGIWKPTSQKKRPEKDKNHQRTLKVMKFLKER